MKERLISEYVNRMTKEDVNSFALKNGIELKDTELDMLYSIIKNDWRTIIFGNPRGILDNIKSKINPHTYSKIEALYTFFKNRYSNL